MKKQRDMSPDAATGFGEQICYGIGGGFATNAINLFIGSFLLVFYTEVMHVNAGTAAAIIGVSKFLDGLSDLVAGRIIDNTHSRRFGKARAWILRMIPCTIIAMLLIYLMPTSLTGAAQVVYIFITYNLASTVVYTLIYVAYMTLNGLMTRNQKSRGTTGGINMVGNVLAALIGNSTIISMLQLLSKDPSYSAYGDRSGWLRLLGIWMIVYVISSLMIVFGTRERVTQSEEKSGISEKSAPFGMTIKALFLNKYWVYNIVIGLCTNFLMGVTGSTTTYYITYVVGDAAFYQLYSLVNTLGMLAAMFLGFALMAKKGKRNTVLFGLLLRLSGSVIVLISHAKPLLILYGAVGGLGYGFAGVAFASMIQDVLTYGEWKNGFSMIGMGNAANSFCGKVGNGLGTVVLGAVMNASGFVSGAAVQSQSALNGLSFVFIIIPILITAVSSFCAYRYDLDKIYPSIAKDLSEGRYAEGVTPLYSRENTK